MYVEPDRPAAELPDVPAAPAAPDADDPDVPAAPAPDAPLADDPDPDPLPIEASVRMYDAPDADAPDADAPDAPLDDAPPDAPPARCRQPVNVTVPVWLLGVCDVSPDPPDRPGCDVWPAPCAASTAAEPNAIAANVPTRFIIGLLGRSTRCKRMTTRAAGNWRGPLDWPSSNRLRSCTQGRCDQ
jgi:hypothetical protein